MLFLSGTWMSQDTRAVFTQYKALHRADRGQVHFLLPALMGTGEQEDRSTLWQRERGTDGLNLRRPERQQGWLTTVS